MTDIMNYRGFQIIRNWRGNKKGVLARSRGWSVNLVGYGVIDGGTHLTIAQARTLIDQTLHMSQQGHLHPRLQFWISKVA